MLESRQSRAIMLALAALDALADEKTAVPRPPLPLRALLAALYAFSNGDRRPYDEYWKASQSAGVPTIPESGNVYMRATNMRIAIKGIARTLGMEPLSPAFNDTIQRLRR